MNQRSETRRTRREKRVGDMIDRRTTRKWKVGGQNPSLVCGKASAPRQSKNPQGLAPRGVYSLRHSEGRTRSRRSMFGSTCELCFSAVAMEAAIDGRIQTCYTPILAVPGMARRQDHGWLYNLNCTRGWSCEATSRCSLRPPTCRGQPRKDRMERRVPGPGRITRSRSRRDLRMAMCRDVTALASRCPGPVRASF
jgi:hypothetical protein